MLPDLPVIGILSHPEGGVSGNIPLSNLAEIAGALSSRLIIITGAQDFEMDADPASCIRLIRLDWRGGSSPLSRAARYAILQLRSSYMILRRARDAETWLFFINGQNQLASMIIAKLLRRRVILVMAGSTVLSLESARDPMTPVMAAVSRVTCTLADRIVVYGQGLIGEYGLSRWEAKISVAPRHIVCVRPSPNARDIAERTRTIGYVGRFSEEKGVMNLVDAMPEIVAEFPDVRLVLIGDGPLKARIEERVQQLGLAGRVSMPGWVLHDRLAGFLEQLRLLVIPSFTEGLPNVMLEAMCCGAAVAATPVGAIPDVVRDGETGFLMESNAPAAIASTVIRAMDSPHLIGIARVARQYIVNECTLSTRVAQYREILDAI